MSSIADQESYKVLTRAAADVPYWLNARLCDARNLVKETGKELTFESVDKSLPVPDINSIDKATRYAQISRDFKAAVESYLKRASVNMIALEYHREKIQAEEAGIDREQLLFGALLNAAEVVEACIGMREVLVDTLKGVLGVLSSGSKWRKPAMRLLCELSRC